MVNNLILGSGMEPCNCGQFNEETGHPLPQNLIQASLKEQGYKYNKISTCLKCNHKWKDYKRNYHPQCPKCNSQLMLSEKYDPEGDLKKIFKFIDLNMFQSPSMPKSYNQLSKITHEHIYNNANRALAQASTTTNHIDPPAQPTRRKKRTKREELNMVIGFTTGTRRQ